MSWLKFRVWYVRHPQPIDGEMRYFKQSEDDFPNSCRKYQSDDWMQYIDMKDCNGKEIYEGDIVLVTPFAGEDKTSYYGVVERVNSSFQVKVPKGKFPMFNDYVPLVSTWNNILSDFEIVGNVHENKDLLDEQYEKII